MAGLVPAIHVFATAKSKTWMPGTRPGMTGTETHAAFAAPRSASIFRASTHLK
jgi:hypothetical protein